MAANAVLTEANQLDESFWTLEGVQLQLDQASALTGIFKIANMRNYANLAAPRTMTFSLPARNGIQGTSGPVASDVQGGLPILMGQGPAPASGLQLFLIYAVTNTNAIALRSLLWGYRWSERSLDTPTGPRRPPFPPFGS